MGRGNSKTRSARREQVKNEQGQRGEVTVDASGVAQGRSEGRFSPNEAG